MTLIQIPVRQEEGEQPVHLWINADQITMLGHGNGNLETLVYLSDGAKVWTSMTPGEIEEAVKEKGSFW